MQLIELRKRIRSYTRDLSSTVFTNTDLNDFINEGIDRFIQVIPPLSDVGYLTGDTQVPTLIPSSYHNLLAVYGASRAFFQDSRSYESSTMMNEFESKLEKLRSDVENGLVVIVKPDGTNVDLSPSVDYVVLDTTTQDITSGFDYPDDEDLEV